MNHPSPRLLAGGPAVGLREVLCSAVAASLALVAACLAASPVHAVTIDMVTVGNPGNAADWSGYGAVNYSYKIGKYEVTIQQYTDFLNAVDPNGTRPYGLYSNPMGTDGNIRGILFSSGSASGQKYRVVGSPTQPITYVSWFDAARFANWMHNGQGSGSTETGAYTLVGGQTSGTAPAVNPGAQFYIPTENEWYKAAYYSPVLNSGAGGYFSYATQSNFDPGNEIGPAANQANYYKNYLYSVTQSSTYSSSQNYLTNVGAFTNSASYYGTFDQSGNVWEWNDLTGAAGSSRGVRGGGWVGQAFYLSSSQRSAGDPSAQDGTNGFRLASPVAVPEPSTWVLGACGLACAGWGSLRRHRKRRLFRPSAVAVSLALVTACLAASPARAVTIDWVTVGNPGNANDTTGYGTVAAEFQIMKFEFTNSQYAAFLNAIDPDGTNPNSVWSSSMGSNARGGISRNVSNPAGSRYAARSNMGDKPVNYVSWWDAARVSNWLHNGAQTYGSTDSSATAPQNTGAYSVGIRTFGNTVAVNSGALYCVPTENQWYKAAYYNPTLNGGAGGYRLYGNGFSTTPLVVSANAIGVGSAGGTGNRANYNAGADWNGQDGNVTTVGTNGGASYYGAFDFSGNVWELNDLTGVAGSSRGLRGGGWISDAFSMASSVGTTWAPTDEDIGVGFRLASPVAVPEPSTWVMGAVGLACAGWGLRRRRQRRRVGVPHVRPERPLLSWRAAS